jgi:hypothetical protein
MRMPQVSERVKEAPAQALRGVFAGLGQLLLITDKLRNKTPIHGGTSQAKTAKAPATEAAHMAATPVVPEAAPVADAAPDVAAKPAAAEDTGSAEKQPESGKTGNVRLLTEGPAAPEAADESGVGEAPLPNYDELTVASLRARLRNLSIEQVRELAEYERAHAGRAEVVAMFERRVAKLEAGA